MSISNPTPEDILDFWFNDAGPKKWYASSPAFDARVRRRFARAVEIQDRVWWQSDEHPWLAEPDSALALIILFDQMTRNIWRGSNRAFAYDDHARYTAVAMIWHGFDWVIPEDRRAFVYTPFMHSEDIEDQEFCIALCADRLEGDGTYRHAVLHRNVIERFGRFPYRNDALGRMTTDAEQDYLDSGGYAPGRKKA